MVFGGREGGVKGLVEAPGARGACQDLRGVVRTNSGDPASSRSYQDVVTIANLGGGCVSDPSGMLARRLCKAWAVCGPSGRADPS